MHGGAKPLFHRDIRGPNIVQRADDPSRWFLIDWDDAAVPTTSAAMHLNQNYHSSSVFRDGHAGEVDVWAVGKVMSKASRRLLGFPSNIVAVGEKNADGDKRYEGSFGHDQRVPPSALTYPGKNKSSLHMGRSPGYVQSLMVLCPTFMGSPSASLDLYPIWNWHEVLGFYDLLICGNLQFRTVVTG